MLNTLEKARGKSNRIRARAPIRRLFRLSERQHCGKEGTFERKAQNQPFSLQRNGYVHKTCFAKFYCETDIDKAPVMVKSKKKNRVD